MQDKKYKASALAVTLIVMAIILASALSITTVSIKERKGSIGAGRSSQAYQAADLGVEKVLSVLMDPASGDRIASIQWSNIGCSCASTGWIECDGDKYKAQLINITDYTTDPYTETSVACSEDFLRVEVDKIKTLGTDSSGQMQRAVHASVPSQ